jgi:hypothetical protein
MRIGNTRLFNAVQCKFEVRHLTCARSLTSELDCVNGNVVLFRVQKCELFSTIDSTGLDKRVKDDSNLLENNFSGRSWINGIELKQSKKLVDVDNYLLSGFHSIVDKELRGSDKAHNKRL